MKGTSFSGCLPRVERAFIFLALVATCLFSPFSCIKPLSEEGKEEKQKDTTEGKAALSFVLDRASFDSCLVIVEELQARQTTQAVQATHNESVIPQSISDSIRQLYITKKLSGGKECILCNEQKHLYAECYGGSGSVESGAITAALDSTKYILTIANSSGTVFYEGLYINRPEMLYVKPGNYKVRITSEEFKEPGTLRPLFGQEVTVKAKKDSTMCISLLSRQMTGGVRFEFTSGFLSWFKGTGLYLSRDSVSFKYNYGSRDYVYFYPGTITVKYKNKDGYPTYTPPDKPGYEDTVLFTRKLKATELVTIKLDYDLTKVPSTGLSMKIDTTRTRVSEYYNVPGIAPYGCQSVWYAQNHVGDTLKLFGYIVGGDATSTTFNRVKPFKSKTNIVVAANDWQTLKEKTMAIELTEGPIRNALNLVDHPEHLKKPIAITGIIVDLYFGYPGMKKVTDYLLLK